MKLRFLTLIISCLFGFMAFGQNANIQKVDSLVSYLNDENRGIGSISIFKDGNEIYNRSFGVENIIKDNHDENTKYNVGYISQIITATLIFKLIENDSLKLDDKLSAFFPEIPNSEKITIKNLLEHSSGLGNYIYQLENPRWLRKKLKGKEVIDEIINQGTSFEPNEMVEHSTSGYYLLGQIVEKLFNNNYASIVEEEIVKPLNLENFESTTDKTTNVFKSYGFDKKWIEMYEEYAPNFIAVKDISATMKDLNTFTHQLFQHKIISENSLELMKPNLLENETSGSGLMYFPFDEDTYFGLISKTTLTRSAILYNEKENISIAIALSGERLPIRDFTIAVSSLLNGKDYEFPDIMPKLDSEDLDKFLGTYTNPMVLEKLIITKKGSRLRVKASGMFSFTLKQYGINKYKLGIANAIVEFFPEDNFAIITQFGIKNIMRKEE